MFSIIDIIAFNIVQNIRELSTEELFVLLNIFTFIKQTFIDKGLNRIPVLKQTRIFLKEKFIDVHRLNDIDKSLHLFIIIYQPVLF